MPIYQYENLDMFYQIKGDGEQALLFIHGLGGYGDVWKYQIEIFSQKYTTIAIDLFGHGRSAKDVDPVIAPWLTARSVVKLMNENIKKPYVAIGHSYAMDILPEIIKLDRNYLKAVVFVDCTYHNNIRIIRERSRFAELMLSYSDTKLKEETELWYRQYIGPYPKSEDIQLIMNSLEITDLRWMFQSVYSCLNREEKSPHNQTPRPDNLKVKIVEAENGLGSDLERSWVNHFKSADYSFFDLGYHFLFVTEKDKFNELLRRFLEDDADL